MSYGLRIRNLWKKILLIIVATVFVLYLSSCGSTTVEGVVIEKYYEPASTYVTTSVIIVCGNPVVIPQTQYRSAQYKILVRCSKEDGTETIIDVSIPPEEYAEIEVGDWYTNCKKGSK